MRVKWMAVLFTLVATTTVANEPNPKLLKDYIGLSKLLKARGVDPVTVNWSPIEMACLGLKTEADQVDYNRCRYRMAVDNVQYGNDVRACKQAALAAYPKALKLNQPTKVATRITNGKVITTLGETPLTASELKAGRAATLDNCMRQRGWNDPANWQAGRSESF
jgi:hypothetical protein